ncbi:ABC transporter ATP-binding protein [Dehalobacterium formicoaceticum]|uniref:ABC transporter ATP-binding protein n=1 Tax=Dehalobacterium formicoaceticum TaxID=51515 RepID=A0ABT1Y4F6_9FIRM|nr:ABC transporter ATP-binding protein [Dehalobacterium formicoaceticum]MCR6545762.1 ABC transporter ATP-binding protein [Dehalobacterium formicoaceticum]
MLKLKNIFKTFNAGSVNEKPALNGVNLHLEPGDFVTVIGGNGAGKSTLLNIIAGVFPVDRGNITLDGVTINKCREHERAKFISRVFQDPMLGTAASMTIEENLSMAFRRGKKRSLRWGIAKKELDLYREHLAQLELGLENRLKAKVGLLSGGQRQALTLLMATIISPKLLLLDEHSAALDPKTAGKVLELTEKIINTHDLTTLMVTHNMRDALKYGNRTIMMHEGRIILDLKAKEKKSTSVDDLLKMFERASGDSINNDRMLLA